MRKFWALVMVAAVVVVAIPTAVFAEDGATAVSESGRVELTGTGVLEAKGVGRAYLAGDFTLHGTAQGGALTVQDHAGDARVYVRDFERRHENADGSVTYIGLNGAVVITGSRVEATFRGAQVRFTARGTGHAELNGHGWFTINGGRPHPWAAL